MECIVDVPRHDPRLLYVKFDPHRHSQLLPKVVECYRGVFASAPWNEWKRCPQCGKKWGMEEKLEVESLSYTHCGVAMEDYWPTEQVTEDLKHEITSEASCWIAVYQDTVVGFIWGYPVTPQALSEKLGLPGLADDLEREFGKQERVAYQDDLGVRNEFRGKKIAKELVRLRLRDFKDAGLRVGVVRTKTVPPSVTYLWYMRDGYRVTSKYGDGDGRVVLARQLTGYFIV